LLKVAFGTIKQTNSTRMHIIDCISQLSIIAYGLLLTLLFLVPRKLLDSTPIYHYQTDLLSKELGRQNKTDEFFYKGYSKATFLPSVRPSVTSL